MHMILSYARTYRLKREVCLATFSDSMKLVPITQPQVCVSPCPDCSAAHPTAFDHSQLLSALLTNFKSNQPATFLAIEFDGSTVEYIVYVLTDI